MASYTKIGLRPSFLNDLESSMRFVRDADGTLRNYNAFDKDIAVVQFYFKKSTVVQVSISPTFYMHLFRTKVICAQRFPLITDWLCNFLAEKYGQKSCL
jgi:hypothetical protein